ncbi:MAG: alpha/beta hydrolase [Bacteroidota bacterium]
MKKPCCFLLLALLTSVVLAQDIKFNSELDGYWTGALIRQGNSVQNFSVEFYEEDDTLRSACHITDWAYYSPKIGVVKQEGRVVTIESDYGPMTLLLDSAYAEMVGKANFAPVHLKKGLRPPRRVTVEEEVKFDLGDITTYGRILRPAGKGPFPTLILVAGRGCERVSTFYEKEELLTQYGVAVVTYEKRGTPRTGFPCEKTTMDQHSADLARVTEQVAKNRFVGKLGYMSGSAGGWIAPKAAAETRAGVDFMITVAGPSTSVKQQQIDCSIYYVRDELGLDQNAIDEAVQFCELEYSDEAPEVIYRKLMILLDSADVNGWRDVLEDSDIPASAEAIDQLWVRRNRYDPAADFKAFRGPFLSILGGDDFVVPYRENIARFKEIFTAAGKTNYRIVVLPSAGHGMEHWHTNRDLGFERSIRQWYTYWKFDRVAPGAMDEVIAFLRDYGFIE